MIRTVVTGAGGHWERQVSLEEGLAITYAWIEDRLRADSAREDVRAAAPTAR